MILKIKNRKYSLIFELRINAVLIILIISCFFRGSTVLIIWIIKNIVAHFVPVKLLRRRLALYLGSSMLANLFTIFCCRSFSACTLKYFKYVQIIFYICYLTWYILYSCLNWIKNLVVRIFSLFFLLVFIYFLLLIHFFSNYFFLWRYFSISSLWIKILFLYLLKFCFRGF